MKKVGAGPSAAGRGRRVSCSSAGMAVSQLNVNYDDGALTVQRQLGARRRRRTCATRRSSCPREQAERRSIRKTERLRHALVPTSMPTEQLLQRVRSMIDQSEQRQQRELALRLSQVTSEVDTQHQADLLRIQQNFGQQQEAPWITL